MPTSIEPAREADLPALAALLGELFSIESDFAPEPERQLRGLRLLLESPVACLLVARAGSRPVGMVSAQLVISTAEGAPSAWIEDVVVHRGHRGSGLGRRLLEAVLAWAKAQGATRAQLLADRDNAPALDFYRRLGWSDTQLVARRRMLKD